MDKGVAGGSRVEWQLLWHKGRKLLRRHRIHDHKPPRFVNFVP